jgi:hypothetical protein
VRTVSGLAARGFAGNRFVCLFGVSVMNAILIMPRCNDLAGERTELLGASFVTGDEFSRQGLRTALMKGAPGGLFRDGPKRMPPRTIHGGASCCTPCDALAVNPHIPGRTLL